MIFQKLVLFFYKKVTLLLRRLAGGIRPDRAPVPAPDAAATPVSILAPDVASAHDRANAQLSSLTCAGLSAKWSMNLTMA
jgi:hypothetical protein